LEPKVRKHIERLKRLLWIEKNEENTFFSNNLSNFSLSKMGKSIRDGICWYPVAFTKRVQENEEKIRIRFQLPKDVEEEHVFQPNSDVIIFQINTLTGAIIHSIQGIIELIHEKTVEISYHAQNPLLWTENESAIGIHLTFSKYTYSVMEKALDNIYKASDNRLTILLDIMLGTQEPSFNNYELYHNEWLNSSQQIAVNRILSAQDVALIHGPPGTGKTTTLVEAIIETLKTESQVMVCAYNNIAVDIIAEKLMERGISVVRIGNPSKVTDELLNVTYEAIYCEHPYYTTILSCKNIVRKLRVELKNNKNRQERKRIQNEIKNHNETISHFEFFIRSYILKNNQVIAATMIGAANKILNGISFSTIFIDEAAQALEPACWVPITKANRVIFAGDHKQLPPTIKSYEAAKSGLIHTLFEKIIESKPTCATLLKTQYRMHESIMNFSSQWFYKGRLVASPLVQYKTLMNNDIPVEWIDTAHFQSHENRQKEGTSIYNEAEVDLILETLFEYIEKIGESVILNEKIKIGIISPYSAQVNLFQKKIKESPYFKTFLARKLIFIKTIDGFQGQERDIIVISLVRSNHKSKIGFLADYRRINVAITRAKKKLFLIGDSSTLCKDSFFEALYSYVQNNGLITKLSRQENVIIQHNEQVKQPHNKMQLDDEQQSGSTLDILRHTNIIADKTQHLGINDEETPTIGRLAQWRQKFYEKAARILNIRIPRDV
jgi:superfamily I DNA and/or RNA helicase